MIFQTIADIYCTSRKEEKGWGTEEKILWWADGEVQGRESKNLSNGGVSEKVFPCTLNLHLFSDDPLHTGTINATIVSYCIL